MSWRDRDMRETRRKSLELMPQAGLFSAAPPQELVCGLLPRTCMSGHMCVPRGGPPIRHSAGSIHEAPQSKPNSVAVAP